MSSLAPLVTKANAKALKKALRQLLARADEHQNGMQAGLAEAKAGAQQFNSELAQLRALHPEVGELALSGEVNQLLLQVEALIKQQARQLLCEVEGKLFPQRVPSQGR